jgi:hypothetical protein
VDLAQDAQVIIVGSVPFAGIWHNLEAVEEKRSVVKKEDV